MYIISYRLFQMDCYHIPLNRHHFSAATLQFQTEKAAKMQDCVARMKPIVKHVGFFLAHIILDNKYYLFLARN